MEEKIQKLKWLIEDFEACQQELADMVTGWNVFDDPACDPGEQFSQSEKVESAYEDIKEYLNQM
jgi:hypothetical protein